MKSKTCAAVPFSLEPKRSCANCVWLLNRTGCYSTLETNILQIIEKVGLWSIFSRPKHGSTSLQNSLFEHSSKSRSASKRRKTAQLRSKTASSTQHNSVLVVTSRSLRGHFAVTSRSQRGHNAVTTVTTRSLRGHYGHYAVTTVTTQSEKAHIRD